MDKYVWSGLVTVWNPVIGVLPAFLFLKEMERMSLMVFTKLNDKIQ